MLPDPFIDELIRLQTRYSGLIWRIWEEDGVNIEFFLEELAIDCSQHMRIANVESGYDPQHPRVVHIHNQNIQNDMPTVLKALQLFFENNFANGSENRENLKHQT